MPLRSRTDQTLGQILTFYLPTQLPKYSSPQPHSPQTQPHSPQTQPHSQQVLVLSIYDTIYREIFAISVVSNHENCTHKIFSTTKYRNSIPDPRGLLSSSIPSQAITAANREVEEAIRTAYGQYSLTVQAKIGSYACHHGVTAPVAASQISW